MIHNYKVMLRPEPEGGYTVLVPSLPGCISYGDTVSHAKEMAKEAIELYLESLAENALTIPNV
jgi:antitoxin HicB